MEDDSHRRAQADLRAKRKAAKTKPKSEARLEKDRRVKEHRARILNQQQDAKRQKTGRDSRAKSPAPGSDSAADGGSSAFAALFAKRSEGFLVDLKFRNAPPRPPVGPCFVGTGLEGELNGRWTKYKPHNAVEANYAWRLHAEPDLGVPLAPSAMDLDGCYTDPNRPTKDARGIEVEAPGPPDLHPDDEALLNWNGPQGDSAAEDLQRRRDRRRAQALGVANVGQAGAGAAGAAIRLANKSTPGKFKSRVLSENIQSWMKKTTYLTNDQTHSVHQFKSLAETKSETARSLETKLKSTTDLASDRQTIEAGFELAYSIATASAGARRHPHKRDVTAVLDCPLLPDATTWGHKYTHVVIDKPPGPVPGRKRPPPTAAQLERAFVADVAEKEVDEPEMAGSQDSGAASKSSREFDCNLLVPADLSAASSSEPTQYDVAQRYDMTVITLKEYDNPHNSFILMIDEENKAVTYQTLWTRLMLGSGRPGKEMAPETVIAKRAMQEEDVTAMERVVAEVDDDLARKHGVMDADEYGD